MVFFQGHQVFPYGLLLDILLCLWPLAFLIFKKNGHLPKIGRGMKFVDFVKIYFFCLYIPNSAYASLEIRHVLLKDNIADQPNLLSWLVFGGISLFGLLCTLIGSQQIVHHYTSNRFVALIYFTFLSLLSGFGVAAGLLDYTTIVGILFLPFIIWHVFCLPLLVEFAFSLSLIYLALNLLIYQLQIIHKPSV